MLGFWKRGLEPQQKCAKGHSVRRERVARTCPTASEGRCTVLGPNANARASVSVHSLASHLCQRLQQRPRAAVARSTNTTAGGTTQHMHSQVAHRQLKQKASPRHTASQQLDTALESCRQVLRSTLTKGRLGMIGDPTVESCTETFCSAAHVVQRQLMNSVINKYFATRQCNLGQISVATYADELTSLAWALCYPAQQGQLLRYLLELYCDEATGGEYLRFEDCGALLEDLYTIPPQDIDAFAVATALTQQLIEYATAVQCVCETAVKSTPPSSQHSSPTAASVPQKDCVRFDIGSPAASSCLSEELPPLNVTIADMLHNNRHLLDDSHGSAYEHEEARSSTGSYCSSEISETMLVHIDTVVGFFRARASKLWPLSSFQTQLRSVFFGEKYWAQLANASQKPAVVTQTHHSIFPLTTALRNIYAPDQPPRSPRLVASAQSPTTSKPKTTRRLSKTMQAIFFSRRRGSKGEEAITVVSESHVDERRLAASNSKAHSEATAQSRRFQRAHSLLHFFDRHSR